MPRHQYGKIVVIKQNGEDGSHFVLTTETCVVGRNAECDIRIQLPAVAKEHCKLIVEKGTQEVVIENLSDTTPTLLNGMPLRSPAVLQHGDYFSVVSRSFRWESPAEFVPRTLGAAGKLVLGLTPVPSSARNSPKKGRPSTSQLNVTPLKVRSASPKRSVETPKQISPLKTPNKAAKLPTPNKTQKLQTPMNTPVKAKAEQSSSERKVKLTPRSASSFYSRNKRVTFGPHLSPEQFVKNLPSNTPIRKGARPSSRRSLGQSPKSPRNTPKKSPKTSVSPRGKRTPTTSQKSPQMPMTPPITTGSSKKALSSTKTRIPTPGPNRSVKIALSKTTKSPRKVIATKLVKRSIKSVKSASKIPKLSAKKTSLVSVRRSPKSPKSKPVTPKSSSSKKKVATTKVEKIIAPSSPDKVKSAVLRTIHGGLKIRNTPGTSKKSSGNTWSEIVKKGIMARGLPKPRTPKMKSKSKVVSLKLPKKTNTPLTARKLKIFGTVASTGHANSPATLVIKKKRSSQSMNASLDLSNIKTPDVPPEMFVSPLSNTSGSRKLTTRRLSTPVASSPATTPVTSGGIRGRPPKSSLSAKSSASQSSSATSSGRKRGRPSSRSPAGSRTVATRLNFLSPTHSDNQGETPVTNTSSSRKRFSRGGPSSTKLKGRASVSSGSSIEIAKSSKKGKRASSLSTKLASLKLKTPTPGRLSRSPRIAEESLPIVTPELSQKSTLTPVSISARKSTSTPKFAKATPMGRWSVASTKNSPSGIQVSTQELLMTTTTTSDSVNVSRQSTSFTTLSFTPSPRKRLSSVTKGDFLDSPLSSKKNPITSRSSRKSAVSSPASTEQSPLKSLQRLVLSPDSTPSSPIRGRPSRTPKNASPVGRPQTSPKNFNSPVPTVSPKSSVPITAISSSKATQSPKDSLMSPSPRKRGRPPLTSPKGIPPTVSPSKRMRSSLVPSTTSTPEEPRKGRPSKTPSKAVKTSPASARTTPLLSSRRGRPSTVIASTLPMLFTDSPPAIKLESPSNTVSPAKNSPKKATPVNSPMSPSKRSSASVSPRKTAQSMTSPQVLLKIATPTNSPASPTKLKMAESKSPASPANSLSRSAKMSPNVSRVAALFKQGTPPANYSTYVSSVKTTLAQGTSPADYSNVGGVSSLLRHGRLGKMAVTPKADYEANLSGVSELLKHSPVNQSPTRTTRVHQENISPDANLKTEDTGKKTTHSSKSKTPIGARKTATTRRSTKTSQSPTSVSTKVSPNKSLTKDSEVLTRPTRSGKTISTRGSTSLSPKSSTTTKKMTRGRRTLDLSLETSTTTKANAASPVEQVVRKTRGGRKTKTVADAPTPKATRARKPKLSPVKSPKLLRGRRGNAKDVDTSLSLPSRGRRKRAEVEKEVKEPEPATRGKKRAVDTSDETHTSDDADKSPKKNIKKMKSESPAAPVKTVRTRRKAVPVSSPKATRGRRYQSPAVKDEAADVASPPETKTTTRGKRKMVATVVASETPPKKRTTRKTTPEVMKKSDDQPEEPVTTTRRGRPAKTTTKTSTQKGKKQPAKSKATSKKAQVVITESKSACYVPYLSPIQEVSVSSTVSTPRPTGRRRGKAQVTNSRKVTEQKQRATRSSRRK